MIVVDTSALVDVLLRLPSATRLEARLFDGGESLHAPHLIDLEVLQVLRRFVGNDRRHEERAALALLDMQALPIVRYPHGPLCARIWQLRGNVTAYDAAYLALAEVLGCALVTKDARLADAPGHRARVEVL